MEKTNQSVEDVKFFTKANTVRSMYEKAEGVAGNAGAVAILKADVLIGDYRKPEFQLFRLRSGFGVRPEGRGNACFGHFCADGEECRMEKYEFVGIADEATTAYAAELEAKWKNGKKAV